MSSDKLETQSPIICVEGLEKTFRMYQKPQDRLKQMVLPRLGRNKGQYFKTFTALKGISLSLGRGETVGIVGRNGSGKSTLLQIICGTLQPTAGQVKINGRVAALLELGAGFNPEFTGRENVYLNGAIIGMEKDEINARFEDIARFADIGQFMDQPTKSYSSGMYVRLAFSVAIHAEPDILVVDEALSVGDEAFQRKCFARIEAMQDRGATILFVSHSAQTVIELCDRAVLLDAGEILISGSPKRVVGQYQRLLNLTGEQAAKTRETIKRMAAQDDNRDIDDNPDNDAGEVANTATQYAGAAEQELTFNETMAKESGPIDPSWYDPDLISKSAVTYDTQGATILDLKVSNRAGKQVNYIAAGRRYAVRYKVAFDKNVDKLLYGFMFKTVNGVELAGANNMRVPRPQIHKAKAGDTVAVDVDFTCNLMPGTYFITAGVMAMVDDEFVFLHRIVDALAIHVMAGTNDSLYDVGLAALGTDMRSALTEKNAGNTQTL